jgi:hypothetical protein
MADPKLPKTRQALPKIVYLAWASGGLSDPDFLVAETDVTKLAELNESIEVGRYMLVEISTLNGVPLLGNTRKVK